jgi:hypothetical protein
MTNVVADISSDAMNRIKDRKVISYRIIIKNQIIDRIITPIHIVQKGEVFNTTYSHTKKIYEYDPNVDLSTLSVHDIDSTKLQLVATKNMQSLTTVDNNINWVVSILEKSGYTLI